MSSTDHSIDLLRVLVHGVIGTVLGSAVGVSIWAGFLSENGYWIVIVMGVLCGGLAAILGDKFWESFKDGSLLNPLNWW